MPLARYAGWVSLLFSAPVLGQTAPAAQGLGDPAVSGVSPAPKDEARREFERGISAFEQEDFDEALAAFRHSADLYPTRAAIMDGALCLRKLNRPDEALEALEALAQKFPEFSESERKEYDAEIYALSGQVGAVEISGVEPETIVFLDGRERGTAARGPFRARVGQRRLRLVRPGSAPIEQGVNVTRGETTVVDLARSNTLEPERKSPVAIGIELSGLLSPGLGGDIAGCSDCTKTAGIGGRLSLRGDYAVDPSLSLSLELGYLGLVQHVHRRPTVVHAMGFDDEGMAADGFFLSGFTLGPAIRFRPMSEHDLAVRLGAGAVIATLLDERTGTFQTAVRPRRPVSASYRVDESQTPPSEWGYVSLGAEIGLPVSTRIRLHAGIAATLLLALNRPRWNADTFFDGGDGPSAFGSDALAGRVVLVIVPGVGATYAF